MLGLLSVMALFVQQVLLQLHLHDNACHAFHALVDLVDVITSTSRGVVLPSDLLAAVEKFLALFVSAFGVEWLTPKFHWLLHFHKHLLKFGILLNCFVLERKHRVAKRYAEQMQNKSSRTSTALLSEVINHHFGMLDDGLVFDFTVGLLNGKVASQRLRDLLAEPMGLSDDGILKVANESRFNALGTCKKNDVVLVRFNRTLRAGRVLLHCDAAGIPISLIMMWEHHRTEGTYALWRQSDIAELVDTGDILDTMVYQVLPSGIVGTILPPEHR
jgi:hypothetical protein